MTTRPTSSSHLLDTVIEIAVYPPWKKSGSTYSAQVPWNLIEELRERLDAMGLGDEWRGKKERRDSIAKERHESAMAEYRRG